MPRRRPRWSLASTSPTAATDTARSADLTPPLTHGAVYDGLLTLSTDDLVNVKPALATA